MRRESASTPILSRLHAEWPLRALAIGATALFAAPGGEASAAVLRATVSGVCQQDCGRIGLADGSAVSGRVIVDDREFTPNGPGRGVVSYDFSFGDFGLSSATAAISGNVVEWGDTPSSPFGISIFAFGSENPAQPGPHLSLYAREGATFRSFASLDAWWFVNDDVTDINTGSDATLLFDSVRVAPVPLPAAGWLLLAGAGAIGALRLGRRRLD